MKKKKWLLPGCIVCGVLTICIAGVVAALGWIKEEDDLPYDAAPYVFDAQYIRTNGYHEDAEYPAVKIIRSVDELNAYYEEYKDTYDLERKDKVYADTTIGFLDACDKYDEAYFEEQILVFVLLEEGSGSIRHEVTNVGVTSASGKNQLVISIKTKVPEVGTDDMAEWHIMVEPEAGVDVASEADVVVVRERP